MSCELLTCKKGEIVGSPDILSYNNRIYKRTIADLDLLKNQPSTPILSSCHTTPVRKSHLIKMPSNLASPSHDVLRDKRGIPIVISSKKN
jgi:hypothetical protein